MDKIKIIILILTLTLIGCKKDKEQIDSKEVNCNCGDVELKSFYTNTSTNQKTFVYDSRNHCTNSVYTFETRTEYTSNEFCLTNQW